MSYKDKSIQSSSSFPEYVDVYIASRSPNVDRYYLTNLVPSNPAQTMETGNGGRPKYWIDVNATAVSPPQPFVASDENSMQAENDGGSNRWYIKIEGVEYAEAYDESFYPPLSGWSLVAGAVGAIPGPLVYGYGPDVRIIEKITQADYDALSTPNPQTLYIIVG